MYLRAKIMFPEAVAVEIEESNVKETGTKIIKGIFDSVEAAVYTPTAALSSMKYLMNKVLTFLKRV